MARYSKEDALNEREFELLLRATERMKEEKRFETKFILVCAGRMGMRGGEIAHIKSDWIDMATHTLNIPEYDGCTFGKAGEPCGYCRNRARDYMETHNKDREEIFEEVDSEFSEISRSAKDEIVEERFYDREVTFDEALDLRWSPKTKNASRSIPFDFDVRIQLIFEEFFERYDRFPKSKATLNRRVNRVTELSEVDANIYPHSLRATAAMLHASRDLSPYALMSTMGWETLETARSYLGSSDTSAARELRFKYR